MNKFQQYIDRHLPPIANHPRLLGYQVLVDEHSNITGYEGKLTWVRRLRPKSTTSKKKSMSWMVFSFRHMSTGMLPAYTASWGLFRKGFGLKRFKYRKKVNEADVRAAHSIPDEINIVKFSDAHYPDNVGEVYTVFEMQEISFSEIKKALLRIDNRSTKIP